MNKIRLIAGLLFICLLVATLAQPVQAGRAVQTVPTAGPSPTPKSGSTPGGTPEERPNPPAPTAILATSPVSGVQPTLTATLTQAQPASTTEPAGVGATNPATDTPQSISETPQATSTDQQPTAVQAAQVTLALLPTVPTAIASVNTQAAGAWCFPAGVLILGFLLVLSMKRLRYFAGKGS